jgi:hypothetical protein
MEKSIKIYSHGPICLEISANLLALLTGLLKSPDNQFEAQQSNKASFDHNFQLLEVLQMLAERFRILPQQGIELSSIRIRIEIE